MKLKITVRRLEPADLPDLEWSGGAEHLRAVADALQASYAGDTAMLVIELANGRLVALGGIDFRGAPETGVLWMLAVQERLQGLGLGTRLIAALEAEALARGRRQARLTVEHDNPRAANLYRRLGYAERGSALESWPVADGRTYVTVGLVFERSLGSAAKHPG